MPFPALLRSGPGLLRFAGLAALMAGSLALASCASTDSGGSAATTAVATAAPAPIDGSASATGGAMTAPAPVPAATTTASSGGGGGFFGMFKPNPNRGVVTVNSQDTIPTEMFLRQGYCPPLQVRPGTESLVVYERGHEDDPNYIRYQGSVGDMARQCTPAGDTLSIKIGIKGRLTAGPKGGAGSATLPIRIAVVKQHGQTVLFSQVFNVPVTVSAPLYSADFQQVIENINVQLQSADRDLIVYVGFDAGPKKPA